MTNLLRIAAAALFVFAASGSLASAQTPRKFDFTVTWSVFPETVLATGSIAMQDEADKYRMGMRARARLAFPRVDWKGFFATEGRLLATGRAPSLFQRRSVTPTRSEKAVIVWKEEGGAPETKLDENVAPTTGDVVDPKEVSPEAVDPLTFLALMYDKIIATNGASCDMTVLTWDGVRLAELEATTTAQVRAAQVDCQIRYRSIRGLPDVSKFVAKEGSTTRIVRFEKKYGFWRPVWIRIDGDFAGFRSTFMTKISVAK
ncbi:MAG: hypothetical protein MRY74_15120 [Neomegalonema sp.]|nr:hypothetical protein [Neomegalonema sp.]